MAPVLERVAAKLFKSEFGRDYPKEKPAEQDQERFEAVRTKMLVAVFEMFKAYLLEADDSLTERERATLSSADPISRASAISILAANLQKLSAQVAQNGYVRAQFTSDVIGNRIRAVDMEVNEDIPALSILKIPPKVRFEIDALKHLTYELHIKSPRLKLIEYRGKQIVYDLFECFERDTEGELLPTDWRERLRAIGTFKNGEEMRQRLICDYIAGMTDAYALDVYSRLKTTNPAALFRPS